MDESRAQHLLQEIQLLDKQERQELIQRILVSLSSEEKAEEAEVSVDEFLAATEHLLSGQCDLTPKQLQALDAEINKALHVSSPFYPTVEAAIAASRRYDWKGKDA